MKKGKYKRKEGMKKEGERERELKETREKTMKAVEKEETNRLHEHCGI